MTGLQVQLGYLFILRVRDGEESVREQAMLREYTVLSRSRALAEPELLFERVFGGAWNTPRRVAGSETFLATQNGGMTRLSP